MLSKVAKAIVFLKLVAYSLALLLDNYKRSRALRRLEAEDKKQVASSPSSKDPNVASQPRNIVILGASFAGYHAARIIASSIPVDGSWNIVIIEPNQHYQFTWTLPRFCVIEGHEEKTFIPYGPYLPERARDIVRWVHHHASRITKFSVLIQETGEEIPYEYLVIATGSGCGLRLPSRVGAQDKKKGSELLREMQQNIKAAGRLVVIGGGAAGVELAADAKEKYPEKTVTLVHSRSAVMHRFGPELQADALKGLQDLGVEVILEERAVQSEEGPQVLTLRSGKKLEFDFCVNATGQTPSSQLLQDLSPGAIAETGHIRIKPTLQIDDTSLSNIYACGDVAQTGVRNPNARAAMKQAQFVADNVVLAVQGKEPTNLYTPSWADGVIKLTLGLKKSVTHFTDGKTELLMRGKEKDETLMIAQVWTHMGVTPFEDVGDTGKGV